VSRFVEPITGSLIHQRATNPTIQESVPREETSRTFRVSLNVLGDGFIEVLPDQALLDVQAQQPAGLKGLAIIRPVTVSGSNGKLVTQFRIGRFGWKCQHASLLDFSADAYINEMGITSPLQDKENRSNTNVPDEVLKKFDGVEFDDEYDDVDRFGKANTEDAFSNEHPFGEDVEAFARFMRATNPPPQDPSPADPACVNNGNLIFTDQKPLSINSGTACLTSSGTAIPISSSMSPIRSGTTSVIRTLACAVCHQPDFVKPEKRSKIVALQIDGAPPRDGSDIPLVLITGTNPITTVTTGTTSFVPDALGSEPGHPESIHPYSDFMMHDIGTGDGVAQTQQAQFERVGLRKNGVNTLFDSFLNASKTEVQGASKIPLPPELFQFSDGKVIELPANKAFSTTNPMLALVRVLNPEEAAPGKVPRHLDQRTVNTVRTAPLWGLRTRAHLMHDGLSLNIDDAIQRHKVRAKHTIKVKENGQVVEKAAEVNLPQNFDDLCPEEKDALRAFLKSL
jgi:hypothetical protein